MITTEIKITLLVLFLGLGAMFIRQLLKATEEKLMKLPVILWICVVLGTVACKGGQQHEQIYEPDEANYDTLQSASLLAIWREDSLGCLHRRSVQMAKHLVKKFDLEQLDQDSIIRLLGIPNDLYTERGGEPDQEYVYMVYFIQTLCREGRPVNIQAGGYCWLLIRIHPVTQQVVSILTPCS